MTEAAPALPGADALALDPGPRRGARRLQVALGPRAASLPP